MTHPDLRLLSIFIAVVEAGGFAAAQGVLNLSLPTISNHIATLESRLGLNLCRRGRSGFKLTEAGTMVYQEACKLISSANHFNKKIDDLRHPFRGSLTIGITDNTISDINSKISIIISRIYQISPDVRLNIVCLPPDEMSKEILKGDVDIAIASFPQIPVGTLYRKLYEEKHIFCCHKSHPIYAMKESDITIEVVNGCRFVGRKYWAERDLAIFGKPEAMAIVKDMESEARLILSGIFLGYLPEHMANKYLEDGTIKSIRPDLFSYNVSFYVIMKNGAKNCFIDSIYNIFLKTYGLSA